VENQKTNQQKLKKKKSPIKNKKNKGPPRLSRIFFRERETDLTQIVT
jgi:hypothetical protein